MTAGGGPARFRVLEPVRDFALRRTDAAVVEQVRRAHAQHHAELAGALAARAVGDESAAAGAAAERISAPAAAALTWAVGEHDPVALPLASSLAVLVRQYGAAVEVLDAIGRAARDPAVRASATTADLLEIGGALSYGDLDLVADLAELALDKAASSSDDAADDPKLLAAHHLAAAADAYRDRGRSALGHAAIAEALAERCGDRWQLGAVRRIRGLALMRPELDDQVAAVAALESAMHTFALAGAGTDMNNCRYMMAAIAPAAGIEPERASEWAEQCAEFARASGNRHELAHAELTLATLATGPIADRRLDEAVATFRAIGDLRCLTRCFLLLADRGPSADRVAHLQQALDVAAAAHDPAHQATAAEQLVQAHWAADDHAAATVAYGRLVAAVGPDRAALRCPPGLLAELGQDGAGAKPGARGRTMPGW